MTWSIDQIESPVFPLDWDAGRLNCDSTFPLGWEKVGGGAAGVDRASGGEIGRLQKDTFGQCGFPGV